MRERFANNANSVLAAPINSSVTSISVVSATPFPTSGRFRIIVDSETMIVTAVSGTTFTVTRGAEGSTAASHIGSAPVTLILTAGNLQMLGRDNTPYLDNSGRPQFSLLDASGNVLTKSSFTVVNGTYATVTDNADGSVSIVKTKLPSATTDTTLLTRSAPATPYSVTAAIDSMLLGTTGGSSIGLGFYSNSTQQATTLELGRYGINEYPTFGVYNYADPTTSSTATLDHLLVMPGLMTWFKVSDDGTNLLFYMSHNGIDWVEVTSVSRTSFITGGPTHVGAVLASSGNTSYDLGASLLAWGE